MTKLYHVEITPKVPVPPHRRLEREYDLCFEELEHRFLAPHRKGKSIVIRGRTLSSMHELHRIRVYETQQKIENLTSIPTGMMVDVTNEFITGPAGYELEESNPATRQPRSTTSMRVFISHNSNDVELATLLIELLRKVLRLSSEEIRCTSVDGYRMQAGAPIDERLRAEVHDAELLIGLITPNSLGSAYVFFELGARWGAGKHMIPLLASGVTPEQLEGPLAGINALNSSVDSQVHQFLEDAAKHLNLSLDKASSYTAEVNEMVRVASESTAVEERLPITPEHPRLSEDAKELLIEAANDRYRLILVTRTMGGVAIKTNGKGFGERGVPRSEAKWLDAIEELRTHWLIEPYSGEGEAYEVTHKGFQVADALAMK